MQCRPTTMVPLRRFLLETHLTSPWIRPRIARANQPMPNSPHSPCLHSLLPRRRSMLTDFVHVVSRRPVSRFCAHACPDMAVWTGWRGHLSAASKVPDPRWLVRSRGPGDFQCRRHLRWAVQDLGLGLTFSSAFRAAKPFAILIHSHRVRDGREDGSAHLDAC